MKNLEIRISYDQENITMIAEIIGDKGVRYTFSKSTGVRMTFDEFKDSLTNL